MMKERVQRCSFEFHSHSKAAHFRRHTFQKMPGQSLENKVVIFAFYDETLTFKPKIYDEKGKFLY